MQVDVSMTGNPRPEFCLAALAMLASFALISHLILLGGGNVPVWILPACAIVIGSVMRPQVPRLPSWVFLALITVCLLPTIFGILATNDRAWDGLTAWTLRARFLATEEGIHHPFFTDPEVYNYTRDYPILQPLVIASFIPWLGVRAARLVLCLFWLGFVAFVDFPLRRRGVKPAIRYWILAGAVMTPMFLDPGHGAVDSGFADLLQCSLLTAAVAGLMSRDNRLLALAVFLLPLGKLEGTIHVFIVLLGVLSTGRKSSALAATLAAALAFAIWQPLRAQLIDAHVSVGAQLISSAAGAELPLLMLAMGYSLRYASRTRLSMAVAIGIAVLFLWGLATFLRGEQGLATLVDRVVGLEFDLGQVLPSIAALLQQFVNVRKFGFVFVLLGLLMIASLGRGKSREAIPVMVILLGGFSLIPLALLTQHGVGFEIMMKEGVPRYTLQFVGVAWIAVGLLAAHLLPSLSPRYLRTLWSERGGTT